MRIIKVLTALFLSIITFASTKNVGVAAPIVFSHVVDDYNTSIEQIIKDEPVEEIYHECEFVKSTVDATCTEPGYVTYRCACGDYHTEAIAPVGHRYTATVVEPTCTRGGYTQYECVSCHDIRIESETQPTEHKFEKGEYKAPTCGTEGYQMYLCKCGECYSEILPATGEHSFESVISRTPSYDNCGIRTYTCSVCGYSYEETIPALARARVNLANRPSVDAREFLSDNERWLLNAIETEYSKRIASGDVNDFSIQLPFELTNQEFKSVAGYLYCEVGGFQFDRWPLTRYNNEVIVYMSELKAFYEQAAPIEKWIKGIVSQFTDGDDLHLVNQIFSYMRNNFRYNAGSAWLPDLMKTGLGSCNAYSMFARHCCMLLGIKCETVVGFGLNDGYHAWNMISINGRPTFWDATYHIENSSSPIFHGKVYNDITRGASVLSQYPDINYPGQF